MTPTAEHFAYLDELRESGRTNMFAAGSWVQEEFGLDRDEARAVVSAWMRTFSRDKTPEERAALAAPAKDGPSSCAWSDQFEDAPSENTLDPRDPDYSRPGIFATHNCPMCLDGQKPCVQGEPHRCEYPHARND